MRANWLILGEWLWIWPHKLWPHVEVPFHLIALLTEASAGEECWSLECCLTSHTPTHLQLKREQTVRIWFHDTLDSQITALPRTPNISASGPHSPSTGPPKPSCFPFRVRYSKCQVWVQFVSGNSWRIWSAFLPFEKDCSLVLKRENDTWRKVWVW